MIAELDQLLDRNLAGRRILLRQCVENARLQKHILVLENESAIWPHVLERIDKMALPDHCQMNPQTRAARRADMTYYMLRQRILLET